MKVPSRSSRGARCNWGLRVHHDGRRVPEAVFLRRAETGFLLLRPGPLPRGALADQGFAAIDFLFDQDTEGPPQCAFGSRAEVIGTCGVRQLFSNKQTCCACGRSDKGQNRTISRARLDDKAEIVAWDQVIVGQSFMKGSPFEAGMIEDGVDQTYGRMASTLPDCRGTAGAMAACGANIR